MALNIIIPSHIPSYPSKMGIQTESAKKVHVNTASLDEKEVFKKKTTEQIFVDKQQQEQQQQEILL
jgi:hypothetical protein